MREIFAWDWNIRLQLGWRDCLLLSLLLPLLLLYPGFVRKLLSWFNRGRFGRCGLSSNRLRCLWVLEVGLGAWTANSKICLNFAEGCRQGISASGLFLIRLLGQNLPRIRLRACWETRGRCARRSMSLTMAQACTRILCK